MMKRYPLLMRALWLTALVLVWWFMVQDAKAQDGQSYEILIVVDKNKESDLAGYRIYYKSGETGPPYDGTEFKQGPSPLDYKVEIAHANQEEYTSPYRLSAPREDKTYYIAVTAYDDEELESGYSNELTWKIPDYYFDGVAPGSPSGATLFRISTSGSISLNQTQTLLITWD
jgi:hypothetical protein